MRRMTSYFRRQIDEISNDMPLRVYGALMAMIEVLTVVFWRTSGQDQLLLRFMDPVCWPFFRVCDDFRILSSASLPWFFGGYILVCLGVAASFLFAKRPALAYASLILLEATKLFFILSDYRFRLNQHYMALFAIVTFLFVPYKRVSLIFLIPFFYFWAGTLKLDSEWISGSALYAPLWFFTGPRVVWATTYVVVLELVLVWGLLFRSSLLYRATFAQLVAFHLMSFPVIGYFYPTLMFLILSIYVLDRIPRWRQDDGLSFFRRLSRARPALVVPAFLAILHIYTYSLPGDAVYTGESRFLTLHMFDARVECYSGIQKHFRSKGLQVASIKVPMLSTRTACDPVVYLSRARTLCRRSRSDPDFVDLDLMLMSRKATDADYRTVVNVKGFCQADPDYSIFGFNDWILK